MTLIPLFSLPTLVWEVTEPWAWYDPYGVPIDIDKETTREWVRDCDHPPDECDGCGLPIGYALVQEHLNRARVAEE